MEPTGIIPHIIPSVSGILCDSIELIRNLEECHKVPKKQILFHQSERFVKRMFFSPTIF